MKRLFLIASVLFLLAAGIAFGASRRGYVGIGATYLHIDQVGQSVANPSVTRNLGISGLVGQLTVVYGRPLGLLFSIAAGPPFSATVNGASVNVGSYKRRVIVDFLVGAGYDMRLSKRLWLVLGGGLHAAGGIIDQSPGGGRLVAGAGGGVGALANASLSITRAFGLYAAAEGDYDWSEAVGGIDYTVLHGYVYSLSVGARILR